jgi:hypothetical protein
MVDGLAFRYRWATDGLRSEDFKFKPGPESLSMSVLMHHIKVLVRVSATSLGLHEAVGGGDRPDVVAP